MFHDIHTINIIQKCVKNRNVKKPQKGLNSVPGYGILKKDIPHPERRIPALWQWN